MNIVLGGIFVYPVKALRGLAPTRAEVQLLGLAGDRRWVLVGPDGKFISQRSHPRLALVAATTNGDRLTLRTPGQPELTIPEPDNTDRLPVTVWNDRVEPLSADPRADQWLSRFLGERCRLAWMDPNCTRPITSDNGQPGEQVSFADGYPCLLATKASLDDLNRRLTTAVPMNRFRPNLVVDGGLPFAEDGWQRLTIGQARFRVAGPCARCSVTTVDQDSGQSLAPEPLKTLATYRQGRKGVNFGINLVVERLGTIQIGDAVRVE